MVSEPNPQPSVPSSHSPVDEIDPQGYLHVQMRVVGGQSARIGKVESFERDSATGRLLTLTVRHGLFSNKLTAVPAKQIKWVNQDSVVLHLSRGAFKRLQS